MMIISISIVFLSGVLYFIYKLRYEFSFFPLYLIAKLQGRNFKISKTYEEIKEALMLTDKGRGIEELIALPAFLPIISLESVNGSEWIKLKRNFLILQKYLPSVQELGKVAKYELEKLTSGTHLQEVDSKYISILTLKIFVNWMFNEPGSFKDILSDVKLEKIYNSSIEYRKEIAFKEVGCKIKKQDSVDILVDLLEKSVRYSSVFSDWSKAEYFSVVMQPFIISPMINVSDIAVTVKKHLYKLKEFNNDTNSFIEYVIFIAHPFPILERYDKKTNTQIIIKLSDLKSDEKLNYGYGPRTCLGRSYAREFLKEFFTPIILKKSETLNYMPEKNHLYSGRDNDKGNFAESIYQLKALTKIIFKLVMEILFFKKTQL